MIDAGSTGSRLHIFEFVSVSQNQIECHRRGSSKAWTPLSAFANDNNPSHSDQLPSLNATHVAHHMLPLFDYASIVIPDKYHTCTSVTIAATAGMRLLPLEEQNLIYNALFEGLTSTQHSLDSPVDDVPFAFTSLQRKDVYTLDGEREGFYGAVAANYLRGVIDAQLRVIVHNENESSQTSVTGERIDDSTMTMMKVENESAENADKGVCTNKFGKSTMWIEILLN